MAVFSFPFQTLATNQSRLYPNGTVLVPFIPVTLCCGRRRVPMLPIADTGADYTVVSSEFAALLGIELRSGERTTFCGTSGEKQQAYVHRVDMEIRDHSVVVRYPADVAFADLPQSVAGLLGRVSFFDHFVVTFNQPKNQILLRSV